MVRPDPEATERDTIRVDPVVDAGVARPDGGISSCDSSDTARNAEGGGLSCIDRRSRSLENEGRLRSVVLVRSLVNDACSASGGRGNGDGEGISSLCRSSETMTHPGLSVIPVSILRLNFLGSFSFSLGASAAFSLLPPVIRARTEGFRIRGKGTLLIFCSNVRTRARISPTICTAVPRLTVPTVEAVAIPFGRGRGVTGGGAPKAGEFRAVGRRVGVGDAKVGRVVLLRSESGVVLVCPFCPKPARLSNADWPNNGPFGVRTTVGVAMPVPGRRVTDIVRVDGELRTPILARGVTLGVSSGADLETRSSSCRSDEVRDAAEGVGERESCDEMDFAELVAVEGAEGNCGWFRASSTRCRA